MTQLVLYQKYCRREIRKPKHRESRFDGWWGKFKSRCSVDLHYAQYTRAQYCCHPQLDWILENSTKHWTAGGLLPITSTARIYVLVPYLHLASPLIIADEENEWMQLVRNESVFIAWWLSRIPTLEQLQHWWTCEHVELPTSSGFRSRRPTPNEMNTQNLGLLVAGLLS